MSGDPSSLLAKLILIGSNAAFLLPLFVCWRAGKYLSGALFGYTLIASGAYHLCKWGYADEEGHGGVCFSGVTFETMYLLDFYGSQLAIPAATAFFVNPKHPVTYAGEAYGESLRAHAATSPAGRAEEDHRIGFRFDPVGGANEATATWAFFRPRRPSAETEREGGDPEGHGDRASEEAGVWEEGALLVRLFEDDRAEPPPRTSDVARPARGRDPSPVLWCRSCDAPIGASSPTRRLPVPEEPPRCAVIDGVPYVGVMEGTKARLRGLEYWYVTFQAFAIFVGVTLCGPSVVNVTLPLAVVNALIVLLLLLDSYLSHLKKTRKGRSLLGGSGRGAKGLALRLVDRYPPETLLGVNVFESIRWSLCRKNYAIGPAPSDHRVGTVSPLSVRRKAAYAVLSLLVGGLALILFSVQGSLPVGSYYVTHNLWHLLGGMGFYVLLELVL
jgi:hypothetical protein